MSDTQAQGSEGQSTPRERSLEATQSIISMLEAAEDLPLIERVTKEQEKVLSFADTQAELLDDGLQKVHMRSMCGSVAGVADNYTKSALMELVDERYEELVESQDTRRPFDEILEEDLEEVVVTRTTDARLQTLYRWRFSTGTVETQATKDGRTHFRWTIFRDQYYDATGEDPKKPRKDVRGGEEWRELLVDLIDERGREITTRGPRTTAVDSLKNYIRRSRAFGNIEDMVDYDALYIDDAPEEGEAEEIWVHNHDIKRICDNNELNNVIGLQTELDARGYTVNRVSGASESTFVYGNKVTYWVLDASIASPATYEPEAEAPAAEVRAEQEDEEEIPDQETTAGEIGAIGADPDQGETDE